MSDKIDIINFATADAGLVIATLGLIFNLLIPYTKRMFKLSFTAIFSLLIAYAASDLISQISLIFLGSGYGMLSFVAIYLESVFSSILMPILCAQLLYYSNVNFRKSVFFYLELTLWFVYFILLCSTWFSPAIYYVTSENIYRRGPLYPALLVPVVLMTVINIIMDFYYRNKLSKNDFIAFTLIFIIPLVCTVIQIFSYGLLLILIGTVIATLVLFIFIMLDQIADYISQKEKIANAFSANLALQMRPHFIYNVMMSIYYLCEQDPAKAQQVTLDFTTYLRKNFSAVAKEDTVPFIEELEHTKAYLAVEMVRFEGSLFTKFDTPHTDFRLPVLVLQPIVENAVKHGVSPEIEPLTITISTAKTDDGSVIRVHDTGGGFSSIDNDDPHIALNNIRTRLEMISGGTLTIESRDSIGTCVVIFIPDNKQSAPVV